MLAANTLPAPSLLRCASIVSFFSRKTPSSSHHHRFFVIPLPSLFHFHPVKTLSMTNIIPSSHRPHHDHHHAHRLSSSAAAAATLPTHQMPTETTSAKSKKKARRESPEGVLRHSLDMCSKRGDLLEAMRLYDDARLKSIPLSQHHYNVLLYLCSSPKESDAGDAASAVEMGLKRGFEIFRQMGADEIAPNEATFTSVARLAAAKEDPELAFDLVKKMAGHGIPPRLRSYGPALFGFCRKGMVEEAYEVDAHMEASGVLAEEPELAALLRLSTDVGREERVYQLLHRLRLSVRRVSETTAEIAEGWFGSDAAAVVGIERWDVKKVKEGVVKGGGGWHGQGWLGKGKWKVARSQMDESGTCGCCRERLVCIDIDPLETENFASSLLSLACEREAKADFTSFQEWLSRHGPFDAVIDGANVGLYNNNHNFSFFQLNSVVNGIRQITPSKKLPLIILHSRRVRGGPAENPNNKKLLESWQNSGALYATPTGSNDDWYWLYAAVSCKCLLVTNDEMRDHLFQLLGTSFFPRWKEKHQVRLTKSRRGPIFHMPPPYSVVIQESEGGSWHIPIASGDDEIEETNRQWVCGTRTTTSKSRSSSSSSSRLLDKQRKDLSSLQW